MNFANITISRDRMSTTALMVLSIISGAIMIANTNVQKKAVAANTDVCKGSDTINNLLKVLTFVGIFLIVTPIIYFGLTIYGARNSTLSTLEDIVKVQYVFVAISLLLVMLAFYLSSAAKTCNIVDFGSSFNSVWVAPVVLLVGSILLTVSRIYYDNLEIKEAKTIFGRIKTFGRGIKQGLGTVGSGLGVVGSGLGVVGSSLYGGANAVSSGALSLAGRASNALFEPSQPSQPSQPQLRGSLTRRTNKSFVRSTPSFTELNSY